MFFQETIRKDHPKRDLTVLYEQSENGKVHVILYIVYDMTVDEKKMNRRYNMLLRTIPYRRLQADRKNTYCAHNE